VIFGLFINFIEKAKMSVALTFLLNIL